MNLAIYGAGGLGREILELARQINCVTPRWDKMFFVVDKEYFHSENGTINGAEVITLEMAINFYSKDDLEFVIAQGEPIERKELKERIDTSGLNLATLIHPNVYIPKSTSIGKGVIIQCNCYISSNVIVCENALIQAGVNVGHDSVIGNNSVVSGLSNIAGKVRIGENTYLGLSALVKEKITIGHNSIVGMGSVVFRSIEDDVIALGNPARVMKKNIEKKVFK